MLKKIFKWLIEVLIFDILLDFCKMVYRKLFKSAAKGAAKTGAKSVSKGIAQRFSKDGFWRALKFGFGASGIGFSVYAFSTIKAKAKSILPYIMYFILALIIYRLLKEILSFIKNLKKQT